MEKGPKINYSYILLGLAGAIISYLIAGAAFVFPWVGLKFLDEPGFIYLYLLATLLSLIFVFFNLKKYALNSIIILILLYPIFLKYQDTVNQKAWDLQNEKMGEEINRQQVADASEIEKWVKNIAEHAENKSTAISFIESAMQEITSLYWVEGVQWLSDVAQGKLGETSPFPTSLNFHDLHITLYTRWKLSPALYLHVKLLTQIMGEFYEAKKREEALRQNTYMQALYETGSRLTHDIKNILQSVGALCTVAQLSDSNKKYDDNEALLELLRRQLPILNQRIASTLDKLKAPSEERKRQEKFVSWWKLLKQRYQYPNLEFVSTDMPSFDINAEVLDSILDNLLQNALEKAKSQQKVSIRVELSGKSKGFSIEISDTGKAMPTETAQDLFKKHINSANGLGVGLYHSAKQALQVGYSLSLVKNWDGEVQFRVELASF